MASQELSVYALHNLLSNEDVDPSPDLPVMEVALSAFANEMVK